MVLRESLLLVAADVAEVQHGAEDRPSQHRRDREGAPAAWQVPRQPPARNADDNDPEPNEDLDGGPGERRHAELVVAGRRIATERQVADVAARMTRKPTGGFPAAASYQRRDESSACPLR